MHTILIVEDEELELEFIEAVIREEIHPEDVIITANTGAQAVRQAKKRHPDIIIMDIMLPEMDGLEAIEEIRKFSKNACISILSAYTDFRYAQRAISLRVFEYMLKPIKPSDFKTVLLRMIESVEETQESERSSATQIAVDLGNRMAANMVTLGFLSECLGLVKREDLLEVVEDSVNPRFIELNRKAVDAGIAYAKDNNLYYKG